MLRILRPSYSLRMFYTISQKFLRMSSYIWDQRELERVEDVQERLIWMDLEVIELKKNLVLKKIWLLMISACDWLLETNTI